MKKTYLYIMGLFLISLSFALDNDEENVKNSYENKYQLPTEDVLKYKLSYYFKDNYFVENQCHLLEKLPNNVMSGLTIRMSIEDSLYAYVDHLRHEGVVKEIVDKKIEVVSSSKFKLIWSIINTSVKIS